ncbi:alpha/beta hydrolase [Micromonospora costi]|uniref:Alpha/beta hydrolase n=1 Tax=Micromonospora costi TaxID=1530042 RepID=A0A3A9ZXJ8_9ACTN|nr:alpha/beta hydrolase [Micromonospora costi]RKN52036.1 alpha/beta hydrolase [Micromonospora costi]
MSVERPTFVLVPGAWHLPSTWDLLRGELDALGYASRAVKLPTTGPDPRGGLREDAAAIRSAVEALSGPVVVVAHSYGGIPATEGVAGLPGARRLVYLAAYVPDVGESMHTLHGVPDPDSADGLFPIGSDPRAQLYADVPKDVADLAISRLVDQLLKPWVDRVTRAAWHTVPATYILTERDASLPVDLQEQMAARIKDVRRIATSHSPFLSRPAELAGLLDEIARG